MDEKGKGVVDVVNEIAHCTSLGVEEHLKWDFISLFIRLATVPWFDEKCFIFFNSALVETFISDGCQVHLQISTDCSLRTVGRFL